MPEIISNNDITELVRLQKALRGNIYQAQAIARKYPHLPGLLVAYECALASIHEATGIVLVPERFTISSKEEG